MSRSTQPAWVRVARDELGVYTWQAAALKGPRQALAVILRDRTSKMLVDWANR